MQEQKIVIFGINGWIGKALLDFLYNKIGVEKTSLILISSSRTKITLIDGTEFSCTSFDDALKLPDKNILFFHLAFKIKDQLLTTSIAEYKQQNLAIREKALKLIEHFKPSKMVYSSSGAVYNRDRTVCDSFVENPYGYLKAQDEKIFNNLAKAENFSLLVPRIFNIAGSYINKYNIYAISDFIIQAVKNNKIIIKANFPVIRSYIEIYDLINIMTNWLFDNSSENFTFDTANKDTLELNDLAHLIINILTPNAKIIRKEFDKKLESNSYIGNIENMNILAKKYHIELNTHITCIKRVHNYLKLQQIV